MIHYHGTPIGGTQDEIARFLIGRHALIPFINQKNLGAVLENCQTFVLDNSAFSAWKRGTVIDFNEYTEWVDSLHRHPAFDWAIIPDVIDGDEHDNDALLEQWPDYLPGVPVWHLHESLARLDRLAGQYKTVALGSSGQWSIPGARDWWIRIDEALTRVCDNEGRPKTRLHGLRMLNPAVFTRMPLSSADSCNVAINNMRVQRFGMYKPATMSQRAAVIADRIEGYNSASVWLPSQQEELLLCGA